MIYKYPICDVFHWFCKIARFFATEPIVVTWSYEKIVTVVDYNSVHQYFIKSCFNITFVGIIINSNSFFIVKEKD
jgi:hypothetical protein